VISLRNFFSSPTGIPKEAEVLAACLDYLKVSRRAFAWRQNSGGMKIDDRYVNFCAAKGASDILGVIRGCGHFLAVECKAGKNKTTEAQADFLACVRIFGGVAIVARSVIDLERELDTHATVCNGKPERVVRSVGR